MVRVLVVDDSAMVRMMLTQGLAKDPEIQVVGAAPDPYVARELIVKLSPDVLTLDVEMPRMDGIDFLRKLMGAYPLPVIMVSALTQKGKQVTLDALDAGAVDCIAKPSGSYGGLGLDEMLNELRQKVKAASRVDVRRMLQHLAARRPAAAPRPTAAAPTQRLAETTDKVIAVGASTGGTVAIRELIEQMPADLPGIVLVQHITHGFTKMFAERLNEIGTVVVREAQHGDSVLTGQVLIAPTLTQMRVKRIGGTYKVELTQDGPYGGHYPAVDVLFNSVAESCGANAVGVLLTGMGADGAEGLLNMRRAGGRTLAQDEASSVVWGMPRVAWEKGGAERLVPLDQVVPQVVGLIRQLRAGA